MSYLQNQMNSLKYDKRLLELNIKSGAITESEYNQYLTALKDDSANATQLDLAVEAESRRESMNGGSHSAEKKEAPSMPTNNDPFGSGF